MLYTLIFGASVRSAGRELGTLRRVILNDGVANQFTVDPPGLFGGPERVVPLSDAQSISPDGVVLDITDVEWKAYPAFNIEQLVTPERVHASPSMEAATGARLGPMVVSSTVTEVADAPKVETPAVERGAPQASIALSADTVVGDGRLAGLIADMGVPRQLLLEGGATVPFEQVGAIGGDRIVLGAHQVAATQPSTGLPPSADGAMLPGALGDLPPGIDSTRDRASRD